LSRALSVPHEGYSAGNRVPDRWCRTSGRPRPAGRPTRTGKWPYIGASVAIPALDSGSTDRFAQFDGGVYFRLDIMRFKYLVRHMFGLAFRLGSNSSSTRAAAEAIATSGNAAKAEGSSSLRADQRSNVGVIALTTSWTA
jgi:hypothetical protein